MCGRFTLTPEDPDAVAAQLGVAASDFFQQQYVPRRNIAPMQDHWIVTAQGEERVVARATWGLVNVWDEDRRTGAKHINARAEGILTTRAFREAFEFGRCVIPADGFIEWTGHRETRRPFWFHRPDGGVFGFAGLYARARLRGETEPVTTFTIITTTPNGVTGRIHDRMPVILASDADVDAWLHREEPVERLLALLRPVDDAFLVARAISMRVNSVQHDDPACLEEAEPEVQGSLL